MSISDGPGRTARADGTLKRRLGLILGWTLRLALVAGCLVYALVGVDWATAAAAVRGYSWLRVGAAVAYCGVSYWLLGLRLHLLSRGELPVLRGSQAHLIGLGVNNVLPAKLGELAKVLYLKRTRGWPFARSVAVVFWERVLDVNMVLVVALSAVGLLGLEIAFWPLAAAVVALWVAVLAIRRWPDLPGRLTGWLPLSGLARLAKEVAAQIGAGLGGGVLARSALSTVAVWMAHAVSAWIALVWIAGLPLSAAETLAVFAVSALGVAVPSAPGSLGVFEAAMVVSLGWFGVAKSEALPIAVVYHLIVLVPSTVLGLGFFALADLGLGELWAARSGARAESDEVG